jgi:hypothetical protein
VRGVRMGGIAETMDVQVNIAGSATRHGQ